MCEGSCDDFLGTKTKAYSIISMQKSASPLCYRTPYAHYNPNPCLSCLYTSLKILRTCLNMLSVCLEHHFNKFHTCFQKPSMVNQNTPSKGALSVPIISFTSPIPTQSASPDLYQVWCQPVPTQPF